MSGQVAALLHAPGVQSVRSHDNSRSGLSSVRPSHHTSLLRVNATLVKMVFLATVAIAFGFVLALVPGATPKKPACGRAGAKLDKNIPK